jgi:hypothetical protein
MKFKLAAMEVEFDGLHPELSSLVRVFDAWSYEHGLPEPVITEVLRTPAEQERIYTRFAQRLVDKLNAKVRMSDHEKAEATRFAEMTEEQRKKWARSRFSWHLVACGVDLRNSYYSAEQLERVMAFLKEGRVSPLWEILAHDVSAGNHIHLGRRDFGWRNTYPKRRSHPS